MAKNYVKSTAPEYYKLNRIPGTKADYKITKFDQELDAISIYNLEHKTAANGTYYDCSCPAAKFDCRHKSIMTKIIDMSGVGSEEFYCHQAPSSKPNIQGTFVTAQEI